MCRGAEPLAGGLGVSPKPVLSLPKDTFHISPFLAGPALSRVEGKGAGGMVEMVVSSRCFKDLERGPGTLHL